MPTSQRPNMTWKLPTPRRVVKALTGSRQPIYIRQHGNPLGPRLVVSHGNGFSADALYPLWSRFLERFEVLVFDVRHHGWNPPPCGDEHHIPAFLDDWVRVGAAIRNHFATKPTVGVFHSLTSLLAVLDQARRPGSSDYAGLLLFELPLWLRNPDGRDLGRRAQAMRASTRRRKDCYRSREELVHETRNLAGFQGLADEIVDLIAETTTRQADDPAGGVVVCCPRHHEARLYEDMWVYGTLADLLAVRTPLKVVGGDPTSKHSFMPSLSFDGILAVDYDYIPETTHMLPLEQPDVCEAHTVAFVEAHGLG